MGKVDKGPCVFPLTSLQIGDLQCYLSDLSLFMVNESKKMYILVDNRPWLRHLGSRREHLWQLMVTKSRISPFANRKARREKKEGKKVFLPDSSSPKKVMRVFSLIEATMLTRNRILLPVKNLRNTSLLSNELHRTLYGFIIFEVSWSNVRGINYLNELQTDTSLALEAKLMRRWEFDCIAQAANSISSWFSGTLFEQLLMKDYLDSAKGEFFYDANEDFFGSIPIDDEDSICSDNPRIVDNLIDFSAKFGLYSVHRKKDKFVGCTTPPPTGPYKRRKVMKHFSAGMDMDSLSKEMHMDESMAYADISACVSESIAEATEYKDVLILCRFNDRDLPFKLRRVIISDLRLLTLLEAGLPSWVLFLQSYPGFCHIYRPWMCPLARVLYVLISVVTVIIGFYDLYKNVPVLKATAAHLCGPLFDWIETWDMVSRVKYLGTMLFLQHCQKAVKWFLSMTCTTRSFFSVLAQPLVEPLAELFAFLLPFWNILIEFVDSFFAIIWSVIACSFALVVETVGTLLSPLILILKFVWTLVTSTLYPIFWLVREILYAPVRLVLALVDFVAFVWCCVYSVVGEIWQGVSILFQLPTTSEATVMAASAYEVSMLRSLWNDLFSQVFRALMSILNGFVAFFVACNRHRLSIYNHVVAFIRRLFGHSRRSRDTSVKHGRLKNGSSSQLPDKTRKVGFLRNHEVLGDKPFQRGVVHRAHLF